MDDAPELLPVEVQFPDPPAPLVSSRSLVRDAAVDLIGALGIGGILVVGISALLLILGWDPGELLSSGWGIAALLLSTQLPLLFRALRRRRRNASAQRPMLPLFQGPAQPAVLRGAGIGLLLAILSSLYANSVLYWLGDNAVQNQIEFLTDVLDDKPALILLVFLIAGLAPVCEEIFFRGVIFGSGHAAGLSKVGVVLSAVLFATVHLSLLLAPFYAFFAVVMCWLYVRTRTLAAPIAAHMTMNGLACVGLLLQGDNLV